MTPKNSVILASRSPRRFELLKKIVPNFEVIPSSAEEIFHPELSPRENAIAVACAKALDVSKNHPYHFVIGTDTIIVFDNKIIGKPKDTADARNILKRLSGKRHQVITGVVVIHSEPIKDAGVSEVSFRLLNNNEIASYVETGEPMDKAGAYAIQGKGAFMIDSYSGSYSNIVGLPLDIVKTLLERAKFPFPGN